MVNFFIHRPIFASAIAVIMVLAGAICLFPAAGLAIPRHHAAAGRRQRQLSRRQRAGRRRHGDDAARAADQRRRGHDLHVLVELERRLLDHHRHLQGRLSPQHRRGRRAEPRLAGGVVAAGDRQPGRRDDQEAEPELRADRQSDLAGQVASIRSRCQQLRLSADRRSAEAAARRRRRADFRRAPLFDAHLARSGQARQSRPHRGRRRRTRSPSRTSRSRPARSASRRRLPGTPFEMQVNAAGRLSDPQRIRRHRRARRSRAAARSCGCATSRASNSARCNIPRPPISARTRRVVLAVFQMPGSNALDLQQRRSRTKMEELSKRFPPGIAYAMHYDTTRFVSAAMHDVVITLVEALLLVVARRLRLPAELAHDDHSDHRHSRFADRDAGGDAGAAASRSTC